MLELSSAHLDLLVYLLLNLILINIYLWNSASISYHFSPTSLVFLFIPLFFLAVTFSLLLLGPKMSKGEFRYCCCPHNLFEKLSSTSGLLGSFLEWEISLLCNSIYLSIAGYPISKLSLNYLSVCWYIFEIDKISDLSYPPQLLARRYVSWKLLQYNLTVEKIFQPKSVQIKHIPPNELISSYHNKENTIKYTLFLFF